MIGGWLFKVWLHLYKSFSARKVEIIVYIQKCTIYCYLFTSVELDNVDLHKQFLCTK